eukprot:Selendium_serpulae@DN8163_c0_g1_i1.p1
MNALVCDGMAQIESRALTPDGTATVDGSDLKIECIGGPVTGEKACITAPIHADDLAAVTAITEVTLNDWFTVVVQVTGGGVLGYQSITCSLGESCEEKVVFVFTEATQVT